MSTQESRKNYAGLPFWQCIEPIHSFFAPQSLGYIRGGGCERVLPWVRSFRYFCGVVLQSQPQVSTSPPSVDILFLVPGWRRLPLESWPTCSAMRGCSWESWRRPGTSRSSWGCWRSRTPPPYPSFSGETNLGYWPVFFKQLPPYWTATWHI